MNFVTLRTSLAVLVTCLLLTLLYIREHNRLMSLRIAVPKLEKEIMALDAERVRLQFEMEQFMNPLRLDELSQRVQYSHLRQPSSDDVEMLEAPQ